MWILPTQTLWLCSFSLCRRNQQAQWIWLPITFPGGNKHLELVKTVTMARFNAVYCIVYTDMYSTVFKKMTLLSLNLTYRFSLNMWTYSDVFWICSCWIVMCTDICDNIWSATHYLGHGRTCLLKLGLDGFHSRLHEEELVTVCQWTGAAREV